MSDESTRVTLRQVARAAGVSHSTVSLALRHHFSIPAETRERLIKLAEKMGYRPDPMLVALNFYRHHKHGPRYQATLAWLNCFKEKEILRRNCDIDLYWKGAHERADWAGYQLEEFWLHDPGMNIRRLASIFKSRQIQGILLPPMPRAHDFIDLPWNLFSVVAFGYSHEPIFHLVTNAQYRAATIAVQNLWNLGYRAISMMSWLEEDRTDYNFSSGYNSACRRLKMRSRICKINKSIGDLKASVRQINQWTKKNRVDVILFPDPHLIHDLQKEGMRLPEGIGMAVFAHYKNYPQFAGIDQHPYDIGVAAVDQLIAMIQRNEKGRPSSPHRILVEGEWINGPSAPSKT